MLCYSAVREKGLQQNVKLKMMKPLKFAENGQQFLLQFLLRVWVRHAPYGKDRQCFLCLLLLNEIKNSSQLLTHKLQNFVKVLVRLI